MKATDAQRMLALLTEVLAIARTLAPATPKAHASAAKSGAAGIYPHQSKYNPWRAYAWDRALRRSVYLGAFSSVAKAKAAQKAYDQGKTVITVTGRSHLKAVA